MLLHRNMGRSVRFVQWAFLDLIVLFAAISTVKSAIGLAGIGTCLVLASLLVLANKQYIWDNYKKHYKKPKNSPLLTALTQPTATYLAINVYILWPATFLLGLFAIYAAYLIG